MGQNEGNKSKDKPLFHSKFFFLLHFCPFSCRVRSNKLAKLSRVSHMVYAHSASFHSLLAKNYPKEKEREWGGSLWTFPSASTWGCQICLGLELGGLRDDVWKHEPRNKKPPSLGQVLPWPVNDLEWSFKCSRIQFPLLCPKSSTRNHYSFLFIRHSVYVLNIFGKQIWFYK